MAFALVDPWVFSHAIPIVQCAILVRSNDLNNNRLVKRAVERPSSNDG